MLEQYLREHDITDDLTILIIQGAVLEWLDARMKEIDQAESVIQAARYEECLNLKWRVNMSPEGLLRDDQSVETFYRNAVWMAGKDIHAAGLRLVTKLA